MKPVFLLTDLFLFALVIAGAFYVRYVLRAPQLRANWRLALQRPAAGVSVVMLGFFVAIAFADSLHYRRGVEARSVLDLVLAPIANVQERTYSSPLAWVGFRKETFERDGKVVRDFPRLKFGGAHLTDPDNQWAGDVARRTAAGLACAGRSLAARKSRGRAAAREAGRRADAGDARPDRARTHAVPRQGDASDRWRPCACDRRGARPFDRLPPCSAPTQVGASVLVAAIKSIRTAFVIGSLTTLVIFRSP
jgi:peptide/nickel transport system permease protein